MIYFNTLNLNQISGGNQIKQGDFGSTFAYNLADEKSREMDVFDQKTAYVNLVLNNNIVFTTTAIVDGSTVTFNIDKAIPTGLYFLEIKIDSYIFPSDRQTIILVTAGAVAYDLKELVPNYDTNMTISSILSDLSQKGIDITDLKAKMNAIYNNTLADHAEFSQARGTYNTLAERLNKADDNQRQTTIQLAENPKKSEVILKSDGVGLNDAKPDLLAAIEGGEGTSFNLLSVPRPKSVTPSTTTFIKTSTNLFNEKTVARNKVVSHAAGGALNDSDNYSSSDFIPVIPNQEYTFNNVYFIGLYDDSKNYINRLEGINGATVQRVMSANTHFIRVSYRVNASNIQVNEGSELLPYETHYEEIENDLINTDELKLNLFKNIARNGNFNEGTASWAAGNFSAITIEGGKLKVEKTSDGAHYRATQNVTMRAGNVYYISLANVKQNGLGHFGVSINVYYQSGAYDLVTRINNDEMLQDKQVLFTPSKDVSSIAIIAGNAPVGSYFTVGSLEIVNLTEVYGSGNEPKSAYEVKNMLDSLYGGYVEDSLLIRDALVNISNKTTNGSITSAFEVTTSLEFEVSGLDLNTGSITGSTVNNWETTFRTGKFLEVVASSNIKVTYDHGTAHVFEYDKDFNFIEVGSVVSSEYNQLSNGTVFIKIMIDGVINNQYPNCEITFLSVNTKPNWLYNPRTTSGNTSFVYKVDVNTGRDILENDSTAEQYTTQKYYNSGLLKLPPNYSPTGKPVKLIIFNHGSADFQTFTSQSFGSNYEDYFQYLSDEGYAIMDVYSWTTKYMMSSANFSSPTAVAALVQGYRWVVDNYNIDDTGVFVSGKSAGGYNAFSLINKGVPILAIGALAPAISPLARVYGYSAKTRLAYIDDFGMEGDLSIFEADNYSRYSVGVKEFIINNAEKMVGYNPFWNGIVNKPLLDLATIGADNTEDNSNHFEGVARVTTVPQKIWVSEDDPSVPVGVIKNYISTIKNGQGIGELRLMPDNTGGHHSVDNSPDALQVPSITTRLGITHANVPLAYVEMPQFFRRFEN